MNVTPLTDEAWWSERLAVYLRHARGGRSKGLRRGRAVELSWEQAERALFEHAIAMRSLAAKLRTTPVIRAASLDVPRIA